MKTSLDTALLEMVDTDADGIGTLLATTLSNDFMPLLRYRIGDLAQRNEQPYVRITSSMAASATRSPPPMAAA